MYKIKQKPEDFIVNEKTNIKPKKEGVYSIFLLKKEDYTTEKAVQTIANKLKIPRKFISYAGNKDKIALTTQYISIKNTKIENLELKDLTLELKGFLEKPISLGDLEGNEFIIKVISEKEPKEMNKIINYFGEQRFSKNNKEIGKAVVKKDFKKATELIDDPKVKQYLKNNPTDFIGALRKIPIKILKIYIHSYQSWLWNKLAKAEPRSVTLHNKKLNIIGFDTKLTKEESNLLKKEGVTQRDFIIRQIPELTCEGSERDLFADIQDLNIEKEKNSYLLKFKLKKGSYATVVIDCLFDSQ